MFSLFFFTVLFLSSFFAVTVSFCAFQGLYGIDLVHVDPLLVIIYTVENDFRIKIVGYSSFEWNNTTTHFKFILTPDGRHCRTEERRQHNI